jgi:G:T-mismatch repair DNA endonuclease (very short patch repair protein)
MPYHANSGSFKKGHKLSPFKGKHLPANVKDKLSKVEKGRHNSPKTEFQKGHNKGKPMTDIVRQALAASHNGSHMREESKTKMIATLKGRHLHSETEFQKNQHISPKTELTSEKVKSWWENPKFRVKVLAGRLKNRRPTVPEKVALDIIQRHKLPFKYTGDGSFIIAGLNPDFVNVNGEKIALDIFGDYWHTLKADKESYTEEGRKRIFAEYGWKLVVVWQSELKKMSEEEFLRRLSNV